MLAHQYYHSVTHHHLQSLNAKRGAIYRMLPLE